MAARFALRNSDPWSLARKRYLEDLNEEERALFKDASVETLFYSTNVAQKNHEKNSKSRAVSTKLEPLVAAISQFGSALDVYSSTYSLAMGPIWGSIRVLLHLATAFEKYFDKLTEMLIRIGDVLPRCQVYQSLFPTHGRLLQAISVAYLDIIYFCMDAKATFRRFKSSTTRHFTIKLIWKDFNKDFDRILGEFRNHVKNVEKEAGLSNMIEASQERALIRADRIEDEIQKKIAKRNRLLGQLLAVKYIDKHLKERSHRINHTGNWLIETEQFQEWLGQTSSNCLWCYGIPGSGKTVLASAIIDFLAKNVSRDDITIQLMSCEEIVRGNIVSKDAVIAYYYFDFSDAISLEVEGFMRALIRQFLEEILIPSSIEKQIDQCFQFGDRSLTKDEFVTVFKTIGILFSRIFIVLDGLDECKKETQATILSIIHEMSRAHTSLSFLLTSREEELISTSLKDHGHLKITADDNSADIDAFIEAAVKQNIESGSLVIDKSSLVLEVLSGLKQGANGMFLWVHFQLLDLCDAATDFAIKEVLQNLPVGMAATYTRIVEKISQSKSSSHLAQNILKWVICAKRPLTLAELSEAIAFDFDDASYDTEKIPKSSRLIPACRNLVVLDERDNSVRLAHHTVQQFLLEKPLNSLIEDFHFERADAELYVGTVCLTYLSFSDFERQITIQQTSKIMLSDVLPSPDMVVERTTYNIGLRNNISPEILRLGRLFRNGSINQRGSHFDLARFVTRKAPSPKLHDKYSLLDYVIDYWLEHARCSFSKSLTKTMQRYGPDWVQPQTLSRESKLFIRFKRLVSEATLPFDIRPWEDERGAFLWALKEGHISLLLCLNENEIYFSEVTDGSQLVALDTVQSHHLDVVRYLFAQTWFDSIQRKQILFYAIENRKEDIISFLLFEGSYPMWRSAALVKACYGDNAKVLQLMLSPKPHLQSETCTLMLKAALEDGCEETQVLVLRALENARESLYNNESWKEVSGGRYLLQALRKGHQQTASLLIHLGDNVRKPGRDGQTALHIAASLGYESLVDQICEEGGEILAEDNSGDTALHIASKMGNDGVIRRLFINWFGKESKFAYIKAMHIAVTHSHSSTIELPLKYGKNGTDASDTDGFYNIALHEASGMGYNDLIQYMLDNGFRMQFFNSTDKTPLQLAASSGHTSTVQLLCQLGADISETGHVDYETPLKLAAENGHDETVQLLLARGARVSDTMGSPDTALLMATRNRHTTTVQLLLDHGASLSGFDKFFQTALHVAAKNGDEPTVKLLLQRGANVNANPAYDLATFSSIHQVTALQLAAQGGHLSTIMLLLDKGADKLHKNSEGKTALDIAARRGHVEAVRLLM